MCLSFKYPLIWGTPILAPLPFFSFGPLPLKRDARQGGGGLCLGG